MSDRSCFQSINNLGLQSSCLVAYRKKCDKFRTNMIGVSDPIINCNDCSLYHNMGHNGSVYMKRVMVVTY